MTTEIEGFDIGDKVKHPKFGTGTIVFRTGEGDKQKVTVKFGSEVGEKKLLASLAKLKLISERPTLQAEQPVEAVPGRSRLGKEAADDDDEEEEVEEVEADDEEEVEDDDADVEADDEEVVEDDEDVEEDEDEDEDDDDDDDEDEDEDDD